MSVVVVLFLAWAVPLSGKLKRQDLFRFLKDTAKWQRREPQQDELCICYEAGLPDGRTASLRYWPQRTFEGGNNGNGPAVYSLTVQGLEFGICSVYADGKFVGEMNLCELHCKVSGQIATPSGAFHSGRFCNSAVHGGGWKQPQK